MTDTDIQQALSILELTAKRKRILEHVSRKHGFCPDDLTTKHRHKELTRARQEAMYRLRKELPLSYPRIARIVGRSDHTTVMHGIKRHCERFGLEVPK